MPPVSLSVSTAARFEDTLVLKVQQGIDPVVSRIDIQYKTPLRGGDEFICRLYLLKEGVKYTFMQDIFRASDEAVSVKARVETVCLVNGRLSRGEHFHPIFSKYL